MNTTAFYARSIKNTGSPFFNRNTGQELKGILDYQGQGSLFLLTADIQPGHILEDKFAEKTYIVGHVRSTDGKLVKLFRFHLTANVTRSGELKDAFGRNAEDPITIATDVPIVFSNNAAVVPVGTDLRRGDVLTVTDINEAYTVLISPMIANDLPGLLRMRVAKVDNNLLAQAK